MYPDDNMLEKLIEDAKRMSVKFGSRYKSIAKRRDKNPDAEKPYEDIAELCVDISCAQMSVPPGSPYYYYLKNESAEIVAAGFPVRAVVRCLLDNFIEEGDKVHLHPPTNPRFLYVALNDGWPTELEPIVVAMRGIEKRYPWLLQEAREEDEATRCHDGSGASAA